MTVQWVPFLAVAVLVEMAWTVVLTAALITQRKRHERLMYRVNGLAKSVTKATRTRTGSQPAIRITDTGEATDSLRIPSPPPPFPVPPPSTNPMTHRPGRHSA